MKVHGCIALLLSAAALTFMLLLKDFSAQSEKRRLTLAAAQRQADDRRRRDKSIWIAERSRVALGIAGEWSNGPSRLTIKREGDTFRAEYPSAMGLQFLGGELQADNQLGLRNVKQFGKLVRPGTFYQGDFDQQAWVELGGDGSVLIVRFSPAKEGRALVMNRADGNHLERKSVPRQQ